MLVLSNNLPSFTRHHNEKVDNEYHNDKAREIIYQERYRKQMEKLLDEYNDVHDESSTHRLIGYVEAIWQYISERRGRRGDSGTAENTSDAEKDLGGTGNNERRRWSHHLSPGQKCDAPYPNLPAAKCFHDPEAFPWSKSLKHSWKIILSELDSYLSTSSSTRRGMDWNESKTNLCPNTNGFTKLTLLDEEFKPTFIGQTYFPQTIAIITEQQQVHKNLNLAPRPVCINQQEPQSGLARHSDNMNFLLSCHLGLRVPTTTGSAKAKHATSHARLCRFTVHLDDDGVDKGEDERKEEERYWTEGEIIIADTSFIHSTRNDSDQESRYVLSFAIWHPDLSVSEREGIMKIHDKVREIEEEGEQEGHKDEDDDEITNARKC